MPLLFSLGIHDSLSTVRSRMRHQDSLFTYLDDVHVVSLPDRTREAYNILQEQLLVGAGIQLHTGKTRVWNRGGTQPADLEELGEEVWSPSGIKILGTPLGSPEFVRSVVEKAGRREQIVASKSLGFPISSVGGKHFCNAGPQCHHILRTLPPSESAECAQRHDDGMWQAMQALMGGLTGTEEQKLTARQLTTLPMRMGGLGLRCARRMAPAAYWSSWADALPMVHERLPQVAQKVVDGLEGAPDVGGCIGELRAISLGLDRQGFVGRPTWTLLKLGARPPPANFSEPGEWHMAGNTSRLPFPSATTGRQQCCASDALVTRPTCGLTQEEDAPMCCMVADERRIRCGAETLPNLGLGKIKVASCRGGCRL